MPKVATLKNYYPDARIITIHRNPSDQMASTLELNRNLYGVFTSSPVPVELEQKTVGIVVRWKAMTEENTNRYFNNQSLQLDFDKLIKQEPIELDRLSEFLNISNAFLTQSLTRHSKDHKGTERSKPIQKTGKGVQLNGTEYTEMKTQ